MYLCVGNTQEYYYLKFIEFIACFLLLCLFIKYGYIIYYSKGKSKKLENIDFIILILSFIQNILIIFQLIKHIYFFALLGLIIKFTENLILCSLLFVIVMWKSSTYKEKIVKHLILIIILVDTTFFLLGIFMSNLLSESYCVRFTHKILEVGCFSIDAYIYSKICQFRKEESTVEYNTLNNINDNSSNYSGNNNINNINDNNINNNINNNNIIDNDKSISLINTKSKRSKKSNKNYSNNEIDILETLYKKNVEFLMTMTKYYSAIFIFFMISYLYDSILDLFFSGKKDMLISKDVNKTYNEIIFNDTNVPFNNNNYTNNNKNNSLNNDTEIIINKCYFFGSYDNENEFKIKQFFLCLLSFLFIKFFPNLFALLFLYNKYNSLIYVKNSLLLG